MAEAHGFSSGDYWEERYRSGGTSGTGSAGALARFKAAVVNSFVAANNVQSVIDFGCGDAAQLTLFEMPADYVGVDISSAALARCIARFPKRRFITPDQLVSVSSAELTLSMDVIYHLVEGDVFLDSMRTLFDLATRFVVIYSSNVDVTWPAAHVRHRRFTAHIAATQPEWRLVAHLPNPYPFDPALADMTSFADFFFYSRPTAPCSIVVPAAA